MAKITIQRVFDTTKALATEAGQSLQDMIQFQAQFAEVALRALRNGLNYADNMDCEIRQLSLSHDTQTVLTVGNKRPTEIRQRRILDVGHTLTQPIAWGFTAAGKPYVTASFSPTPTDPVSIEIIILY
jgi:hypothetical protein